jgi:hypothetical protein
VYTYDAATGPDCYGTAPPRRPSCIWSSVAWTAAGPKCIGPGATKVTFQAWGTGTVEFAAAGVKFPQLLTSTPTPYTIDISASGYAAPAPDVAFVVTFTSANSGTIVNVDDIKWVQ